MASQETQTIAAPVQLQSVLSNDAGHTRQHCGTTLSASSPSTLNLKSQLAVRKSSPESARDVMDHAAVCESRAGLGRDGSAHASAYRGFRATDRVTGRRVSDHDGCRRCGEVLQSRDRKQERHGESCCRGVTWAAVDVCGEFEKANGCGGGDERKCRHCGSAVRGHCTNLKSHLAACKSLPDSVRAVMDHAAVCESRAGLGRYGGVHASVYRGFRVTGWGVNECRCWGRWFEAGVEP